jgi:hypothetical protein
LRRLRRAPLMRELGRAQGPTGLCGLYTVRSTVRSCALLCVSCAQLCVSCAQLCSYCMPTVASTVRLLCVIVRRQGAPVCATVRQLGVTGCSHTHPPKMCPLSRARARAVCAAHARGAAPPCLTARLPP